MPQARQSARPFVARLLDAGHQGEPGSSSRPSPDSRPPSAAAPVGEFHTGRYAQWTESSGDGAPPHRRRRSAWPVKNGIEPHAGHGLTFDNVVPVAAIPQLRELNIGHFLIGEAIFSGLGESVGRMQALMDEARG
jgi:pyridoxine 5-phosphate synthase